MSIVPDAVCHCEEYLEGFAVRVLDPNESAPSSSLVTSLKFISLMAFYESAPGRPETDLARYKYLSPDPDADKSPIPICLAAASASSPSRRRSVSRAGTSSAASVSPTHDSMDACSIQHFCPACRAPYNVVTADPALVPSHLRPHLLPQIRPVFFDALPQTASASTSKPTRTHADPDLSRALAENTALRLGCATWRRRAEVHAAANQGLLALARTGKTHALRMQAERDEALRRCALLKRKLCELVPGLESKLREVHESLHVVPTQSQPYARAPHAHPLAPLTQAPVARAPSRPLAPSVPKRSCSPVCIVGPPLKRRRHSASIEVQDGQAPNTNDAPHALVPSIPNLVHAATADAPKSAPPSAPQKRPRLPISTHRPRYLPIPRLPSTSPSPLPSPRLAPALAPALWTPPPPEAGVVERVVEGGLRGAHPCALMDAAYRGVDATLVGRC
ncbi:hypothetical protein C8J57DRAFT_1711069 [Mycena rebaudengoi]|nr:hypothetical protein C8J57DRAFT_1711069 [Mycena rebaudengoi]